MFYQEKYIKLHDDVLSKTLVNNLMKIESEYLERGNKSKIAEQEELLVVQDQVIKRKNVFNIMVVIAAFLLALLLYILHRSNAERKLANQLLDQRVRERTATLEQSHLLLKQSFSAKDAKIVKTLGTVKHRVATLRGLCAVALIEGHRLQSESHLQQLTVVTSDVVVTLDKISDTKAEYDL